MKKQIPFKLSFKLFEWLLALIIAFSTYLGFQFYQVTLKAQTIENQRFEIVSSLNDFRGRTDNLSYLSRHFLFTLDIEFLEKYQKINNSKNSLIYGDAHLTEFLAGSDHHENTIQSFSLEERVLFNRVIADDAKLRMMEKRALEHVFNEKNRVQKSPEISTSELQSEDYLRLNLEMLSLLNNLLVSVNHRFQQQIGEVVVESTGMIYTIPAILIINLLLLLASFVFINTRMREYHTELEGMSFKDFLTGVHNRKYLMEAGPFLLSLNRREKTQVAVLLLDIDKFKAINDLYGHDAGDEVLVAFSKTINKRMRKGDIFSRFGGEEFVLMLNNVRSLGAEHFANELRIQLSRLSLQCSNGAICYTVSIGVVMSDDHSDLTQLISRADEALYRAKNSGRNRVVMAEMRQLAATG
ncbi:MAG: GGDEF domain-containing protein [Pseudomonadales bacterium]|nr:GGDEF domain-containing protein [Pseudomonadales bacterium]NRA17000.1 GGDEF domain-containing protein [Oceanospirillaceae bacterium]